MTSTATTPAALSAALARVVPAQRTSDAFTAYASVHQLSIALQRAHSDSLSEHAAG